MLEQRVKEEEGNCAKDVKLLMRRFSSLLRTEVGEEKGKKETGAARVALATRWEVDNALHHPQAAQDAEEGEMGFRSSSLREWKVEVGRPSRLRLSFA